MSVQSFPYSAFLRGPSQVLADLVAGADTGLLTPFARNLASWRSTAEAWADPSLAWDLQGPFDGTGPVGGSTK